MALSVSISRRASHPVTWPDRLAAMPDEVAGLTRRRGKTGADNATVIYFTGEESGPPQYGLVVALVVPERDVADAVVELQ